MDKLQELKQIIKSQNIEDYKSFFLYGNVNLIEINTDTFDLLIYLIENKSSNQIIEFTIEQYHTLNYTTKNGKIPLFLALENEYFSIAKILLNHGADINYSGNSNCNVLIYLYHNQRLSNSMLYFILNNGININYKNNSDKSLLFYVVNKQDIILLQKIIKFYVFNNDLILKLITVHRNKHEHGFSTHQLNTIIETEKQKLIFSDEMYYSALQHKNLNILKLLFKYDSQESLQKIQYHSNILYKACSYQNNYEIVHYLIDQGVDVNEKVKDTHYTPLMKTAQEGFVSYAKLLIDHGADVNAQNVKGFTPLMFAAENNKEDVVKQLVESGADVNLLNFKNCSALMYACQEGYFKIAKYLIEKGADINAKDYQNFNVLMSAVQSENKELIEYILNSKNLKLNEKNNNGWNALMLACFRGRLDIIKDLIDKGESMNEKDINGFSSLMIACLNGRKNIVQYLVEQGINVDDKNRSGFTALMVVSQNGHKDIAKILLDHGANINAKDNLGNSALIYATTIKQRGIVDFLIQHGANINVKNQKGDSPIIIACNNGSKELIELLVRNGVDINTKNNINLTPLQITQKRGFYDISNFLISCGAQNPENEFYL